MCKFYWQNVCQIPGAPSHLSRDTLFLARENNIDFLLFPPHTAYTLQPLVVRVFGLLMKTVLDKYKKPKQKNKKDYLSRYHFCTVPTPVWLKAVTPINILGGFQGSGMWPLHPASVHLISDNDSLTVGVILGDSDVELGHGYLSYSK
jgi:hypothetical protein